MRLPVVPQISTKDGVSNKNARLTNCLKESKKGGDKAVVRPGLVLDAQASGVGNGLVVFNNELVSVYGATLGLGVTEGESTVGWVELAEMSGQIVTSITYFNGSYYYNDYVSDSIYSSSTGDGFVLDGSGLGAMAQKYYVYGFDTAGVFVVNGIDTYPVTEIYNDSLALVRSVTHTGLTQVFPVAASASLLVGCGSKLGASPPANVTYFFVYNIAGDSYVEVELTNTNTGNSGDIVFGAGKFVAAAKNSASNYLVSSADGLSWADVTPTIPNTSSCVKMQFIDSLFVLTFVDTNTSSSFLLTSPDGTNWTEITPSYDIAPTNPVFRGIGKSNSLYRIVTENDDTYSSSDLTNWAREGDSPFMGVGIVGSVVQMYYTNGTSYAIGFAEDGDENLIYSGFLHETNPAGAGTIPALATITGTSFDFAQSPL